MNSQIAEHMGISRRTVSRMLCVNPEYMCVDGTQTRRTHKLLEPYRKQIQELIERGFQPSQILTKLRELFPSVSIKRTTLSDFCMNLRAELFEYAPSSEKNPSPLYEGSILLPYTDRIREMLADSKPITVIFAAIKEEGYSGSYSFIQQYCLTIKPLVYRTKKAVRKIKRRDLTTAVWSDNRCLLTTGDIGSAGTAKSDLSEQDVSNIETRYPVLAEIISIICEFRTSYSQKDIDAVKTWCDKYALCKFPAICSFINGIQADSDAFYNSMKYQHSNGLLEGCVNKLKAIKRSMYGRAGYLLLRAKLLLANTS